jgi:DNA repair protein RadC
MEYKNTIPEIQLKYKSGEVLSKTIRSSKDAYELFMKFYDEDVFELTESVIVIYLNSANETIGWMRHSTGGMGSTVVDPRLIFVAALKCGATGIMVSHNHPSGQLRPSNEDNKFTKRLKEGGEFLQIRLIEHIIATRYGYYSYADEGGI